MPIRTSTNLPCEQLTVADGNWAYKTERGPIHSIVLHTMVGTVQDADARFNTANSQVSAQYGLGLDGKLYQWVDEDNVAYHAGDWIVNQTSIGIECEDGTNPQTNPTGYNNTRPDALYEAAAKLVADICKFYDFPADTEHIFRHGDVIDKTVYPGGTACPDALDTGRIIAMAHDLLNPKPTAPTPAPDPVVQPTQPVEVPQPIQEPSPIPSVTPQDAPGQKIVSNPVVEQALPVQTATNSIQTPPSLSEAISEPSNQGGKVPFTVNQPISTTEQPNPLPFDGLVRLIIKALAFIGIEVKQ